MIRKCEVCGNEFSVYPSLVKQGCGKFCSGKCRSVQQIKRQSGKDSHLWKGGRKERTCKICGKMFLVYPSGIKRGQGKFCSKECQGIWHGKHFVGEKSNCWKGGKTERQCLICNKIFSVYPSGVNRGQGKFCSKKCQDISRTEKIVRQCLICGKEFSTKSSLIKIGQGKLCSKKCSGEWYSRNFKGEKNHFWKGGITPKSAQMRNGRELRHWRESVLARDNWTCQKCKQIGGKLTAHHIKPFDKFPELRFVIDNGLTLCEKCHKKTRKDS